MNDFKITLRSLPKPLAICRFPAGTSVPVALRGGSFYSETHAGDEISVLCDEERAGEVARVQRGWHAWRVVGHLDFALTGILASLAAPLAEAKISIFVLSTFDTDYLLVPAAKEGHARAVLARAGILFAVD